MKKNKKQESGRKASADEPAPASRPILINPLPGRHPSKAFFKALSAVASMPDKKK
jgi:hypothetical protein